MVSPGAPPFVIVDVPSNGKGWGNRGQPDARTQPDAWRIGAGRIYLRRLTVTTVVSRSVKLADRPSDEPAHDGNLKQEQRHAWYVQLQVASINESVSFVAQVQESLCVLVEPNG